MVLLAGGKGTASLELWTGQLSWSEKVLSPLGDHKAGLPGAKIRFVRWDKQNRAIFPLLWGKKDPREVCSTPSHPGGLGKAAGSNQPEAPGVGAAAGASSPGAAGCADAFLQFDQTFSSAF